jgi:hypothetical protein
VAYMAPEQLRGEVLDQRVDLYGLGVVLYELLTLNMPYEAMSDASLVQKVLHEAYVPPAVRRPELPLALREVLTKLLAKNRDERYGDCRTLQADLERYIHATGETASGYALGQLVGRLVPTVPVGTPVVEPEMPIFTPTALGASEASPAVLSFDAGDVDGEAKTAVASKRQRRAAPEGFAFPGALEAERAPVRATHPLGVDFAHTDLHGSAVRTDPSRGSPRGRSGWLLGLVVLGAAGLWFVWSRILQPPALVQAASQTAVATPTEPPPPPPPVLATPPQPQPPAPQPPPPAAQPAPKPSAPVATATPPARAPAPPKSPTPATNPDSAAQREQPAVSSKLLGAFEAVEAQASSAPAAEQAQVASVRFESQPPLHVRIGDRILGTTPVVVRLPAPGPVDVELFDTGLGLTRREHVELAAGDNGTRTVTFEKGAIDFQLQPGITVFVDGKKLGQAPFEKPVPLYEGKHPVRLVLEGQEERRLVTVIPGETETLEFTFER